ncbi:hypothetical protein BU24DRAFT_92033 [Aaosphaeria arxii CBS 175.79]|uniref:Zn(2)-C6 fungal-type domain-containing protein n=1 Tax=Aaosphaeria arxii CBS 175.79 TaxID=1450172 RepID=A0A6A5X731_9PLEO|nr:uncharacterized protein BU24DRAFT_92033 [Aaosphaeria arxii CBS 175.79]KAF2008825.1 hypothetical protein BU24DRAFT_92033 [Aaosphaeria arxii CBS 175.79]
MSPQASPQSQSGSDDQQLRTTGRIFRRSRQGCWTCRSPQVKKRCDEQRPVCGRCSRLKIACDYTQRPSVAERRRAKELANDPDALVSSQLLQRERTTSPTENHSLTLIRIPAPDTSASSVTLLSQDHEAIHYFRTATAKTHHTKTPDFGLFSIMFDVAQRDPMVMHMVIAIGQREMDLCRVNPDQSPKRDPIRHYASALRLMASAIAPENNTRDLDAILTVIWLMLLYEQQFGDAGCDAYVNHLTGASSLLQHHVKALLPPVPKNFKSNDKGTVFTKSSSANSSMTLSIYSARILIWLFLLDASASSTGIGGQITSTLLENKFGYGAMQDISEMEALSRFHRFSNPLYRLHWGDAYPQSELLDDVENRNIYTILGQCSQLRFMTARLASLYQTDAARATGEARKLESAIEEVGYLATESLEVASCLSPHTDNRHRLVANIRAIVPMYYAAVLDFMRLTKFDQPLDDRQQHALREIMNLAFQSFKHDGDIAMTRVAWPLFIAALETNDLLHREWILARFAAISKYGSNYQRAHWFLLKIIPMQERLGKRVNLQEQLRSMERFVLG